MTPEELQSARGLLEVIERVDKNKCICDSCEVDIWLRPLLDSMDSLQAEIRKKDQEIERLQVNLIKERMRYISLFPECWNKKDRADMIIQARNELKLEGLI